MAKDLELKKLGRRIGKIDFALMALLKRRSALTKLVAQYKIKAYENRHMRDGADFKGVEGIMTQIECPPEEPLLAELRAFIDSIKTRQAPRADAQSGYDAVRVLNAALESVKTGKAVSL